VISVRNLSKSFGAVAAVEDASLDVGEADRLAVVGPSAGGKTTLLRLIAGLEEPDAGEVVINGMLASRRGFVAAPHTRSIGMVFQRPALWPHMTVAANIGFGLDDSRSAAVDARIEQLLAALELEGLENRRPHELSGGQAQRVALGRALAPGPRILLLNEPFQNLDDELAG